MKQFDITYFHGPFAQYMDKPEIIADIAASGMTQVPLHYDTETNKKALPLLSRYGMTALVSDPRLRKVYDEDDIAGADAVVREVVEDYAAFDNIHGWDIVDEPQECKFPVIAAIVNALRFYAPETESVINLFPNYATPQQLGSKDYMSHLEAFVNIVNPDLISYDHYHFRGRKVSEQAVTEGLSERERLIQINAVAPRKQGGGFFENIADVRAVAQKYGIDPMLIILLTEHGNYRNLTRGELLWEVNMCLAYGMRRISYFTYWVPDDNNEYWRWDNAMCNRDGEKLPHYYDAQAINAAIKDIGSWLFDKNSTEVFHIGTPELGGIAFEPYAGISAIDGDNGVIGFFDDGSVYLVNRDFQNTNSFTLHTDKAVTIRKNGYFADLEDLTITLGAGEAVLLKLA